MMFFYTVILERCVKNISCVLACVFLQYDGAMLVILWLQASVLCMIKKVLLAVLENVTENVTPCLLGSVGHV